MVALVSKLSNLTLVIDPGGTRMIQIGPGRYEEKPIVNLNANFDNGYLDLDSWYEKNKFDLENRGWTMEKVLERIRSFPSYGLTFHEVKEPTSEEKKQAAEALRAQAKELEREAAKIANDTAEILEKTQKKKTATKRKCICKKCKQEFDNLGKLRWHIEREHTKLEDSPTKTIL